MKRIASTSSVFGAVLSGFGGVYTNVWKVLVSLCADPYQGVADFAKKLCGHVKHKVDFRVSSILYSCLFYIMHNSRYFG